jgi:mono/diheme cytochrome c family protein
MEKTDGHVVAAIDRGGGDADARRTALTTCGRLALEFASALSLSLALALGFGAGAAEPASSPMQAIGRGRLLYQSGAGGDAACARCHGRHGEGQREGGVEAPPLRGARYSTLALEKAVNQGMDAKGRALHPLMPRYRLDADAIAVLAAYLDALGPAQDAEPGVEADVIRVATILPPGAEGEQVRRALEAVFAPVNAGGGVYGRRIELLIDPAPGQPVLAHIAGVSAPPDMLSIGALTPPLDAPDANAFGLLPSWTEQARMLADHVAASAAGAALTLVYDDSVPPALIDAVRADHPALIALPLRQVMRQPLKSAVMLLGDGVSLAELAAHAEAPVFALSMQAGAAVFQLPASVSDRVALLYPATLSAGHGPATLSANQLIAGGAAQLLVQAHKRTGRQLDRAALAHTLEHMRDVRLAGLPQATFTPNQHSGIRDAYMVRVNPLRASYVPYQHLRAVQ